MTEYCIHAANVLYLASFLSRDMLWLRVLTCFGLSLGVIFFVTCSTPLYGPAGWHVVFLIINAYQIFRLVQERRETDLPENREVIGNAALEDFSRDELLDLLAHEMSGTLDHKKDLCSGAKKQLTENEKILRRMVLDRLSRRELVNLLSRRLWKPIQRRFRNRRGLRSTSWLAIGVLGMTLPAIADPPGTTRSTGDPATSSIAAGEAKSSDAVSIVPSSENHSSFGRPAGLPRPSGMSTRAFEQVLFPFLKDRTYIKLGWSRDKAVRDTGPFIDGTYYGTHPAVRVFYSPGVMTWLIGGRTGNIPDGAMIIKEQYAPPAARHEGHDEDELAASLESWTVMVKDSEGSIDGWFWSNPGADAKVPNTAAYPFEHPYSGFGLYCVRCHASTESPKHGDDIRNEMTFSSLRNIEGFPGEPILFRVDDSWREPTSAGVAVKGDEPTASEDRVEELAVDAPAPSDSDAATLRLVSKSADVNRHGTHPACLPSTAAELCLSEPNPAFHRFFGSIQPQHRSDIAPLPPVTKDWVWQNAAGDAEFLTSNQCMNCHAGLTKPFGPTMFVPTGDSADYGAEGWNISPYNEWRWTPMGLAGRDPIFLAQMESELVRAAKELPSDAAKETAAALVDTCFRCHGAMGHHQHTSDHRHERFEQHFHTATSIAHRPMDTESKYGALARDGVSCMVCHRAVAPVQAQDDDRPYLQHYLESSITGRMTFGKVGEIYGPYRDDDIQPYVMHHATGIVPKHSSFLKSSQLCGSCHTVNLPAIDKLRSEGDSHRAAMDEASDDDLIRAEPEPLFRRFHHHLEQATYLEWLNSDFQDELGAAAEQTPEQNFAEGRRTCQQCHMSDDLHDDASDVHLDALATRIAIVQDRTYPDAENLTKLENLDIKVRAEGYRRHNFAGLNLFLLELFNQHDDILGVRKNDYMTGSKLDIEHARLEFLRTAQQKTVQLSVRSRSRHVKDRDQIEAIVNIVNLAGHRFPSGVGFRRAFLEVRFEDTTGDWQWTSGSSNELGLLTDADGNVLAEETFRPDASGVATHHVHREWIESSDQVQVYETLLKDAKGRFTTSFVHGCSRVKDNRLLPRGWSAQGPDPKSLTGSYLRATHPGPVAKSDADYSDGRGADSVGYRVILPGGVRPQNVQVTATLHYQAIPPYFLKILFDTAPNGPAAKRLHFLCGNLDLSQTPIAGWKLPLVSASAMTE